MEKLNLLRSSWLRRRFIKGAVLKDFSSWMDDAYLLEEQIKTNSTFQKIGPKVILEVTTPIKATGNSSEELRTLVEVVGIPSSNLEILDLEPCDILICSLPYGPFESSFDEIFKKARNIQKGINLSLEDFYHIVFDGEKIALHFFIQKDYIHSEH